MVRRNVSGAHYGLRDWLGQRVSAVLMALYVLFLLGWLAVHPHGGYDAWSALFSGDLMRAVTWLVMALLCYHAWVGMRDIVMDYVKPASVRLALHVAVLCVSALYLVWTARILWGVA